VKVSSVRSATITDSSIYTGSVVSRQSIVLMPQVDGHISRIFAKAGQEIRASMPILEISPEHQEASVRSYLATQDSAQDELTNAKHTLASFEATRNARVSALKLAQSNFDRYSKLRENGVVSQEELETRQNNLESARAELISIDSQIKAEQAMVHRMDKMINASLANLDQQKTQLNYYTIKAPFDGIIGDIPAKIGEYVNSQSRLASVTQNRPLEIYVSIPVEKLKRLKLNMPIELLDSDRKVIGVSRIFFIAPNVAADSQTVLVKSSFSNEHNQLRADQQLQARLIWQKTLGLLIPTEAVSHQSGQDFVFLENTKQGKSTAQQVPVRLGAIEGGQYQVLEGLKAGQKLVVSGVQNLSDGAPINASF
jgi:multidrug efflux pump subunit AcrA (membrane-fusion protein)